MISKTHKSYIIYAFSNETGKSIYSERVKTQDEVVSRGLDLSVRNEMFYYLAFEVHNSVMYDDSYSNKINNLIPIHKETTSKLLFEFYRGIVYEHIYESSTAEE